MSYNNLTPRGNQKDSEEARKLQRNLNEEEVPEEQRYVDTIIKLRDVLDNVEGSKKKSRCCSNFVNCMRVWIVVFLLLVCWLHTATYRDYGLGLINRFCGNK